MPVSRRTGKRYAASSEMSKAGYEDVTHCHCGKRLVLSGKVALQFETNLRTGETIGWHHACKRPPAPPPTELSPQTGRA